MEYYSASNQALGTSQLNLKQAMLFPRENMTRATLHWSCIVHTNQRGM